MKSCWLTFSHSYSGVSGKVGDKFMSTVAGDISKGLYKKYCSEVEELKHTNRMFFIFSCTLCRHLTIQFDSKSEGDDADKQIYLFPLS